LFIIPSFTHLPSFFINLVWRDVLTREPIQEKLMHKSTTIHHFKVYSVVTKEQHGRTVINKHFLTTLTGSIIHLSGLFFLTVARYWCSGSEFVFLSFHFQDSNVFSKYIIYCKCSFDTTNNSVSLSEISLTISFAMQERM
jgi:hypothetical protein